jgi:hypothetical protein
MPTPCCPGCLRPYRPGTAACPCGRLLEAVAPEVPDESGLPPLEPVGPPPPVRKAFWLRVEGGKPVRFRGLAATEFEVDAELLLGRRDAGRGIYPDVDLTDFHDERSYLSRRHAQLRVDGGRLFVTDLPGADTTAVNDLAKPVPGNAPLELHNGDHLYLGDVVTLVVEVRDEVMG